MKDRLELPVVGLRGIVIFPQMVTHFDCGRVKSVNAVETAEMNDSLIFLVPQKDETIDDIGKEDLYKFGTVASIKQILKLPGGILRVLVEGLQRAEIEELEIDEKYLKAEVKVFEEKKDTDLNKSEVEIEAAKKLIMDDLDEYSLENKRIMPGLVQSVMNSSSISSIVDTVAGYINLSVEESESLIQEIDPYERLLLFHGILTRQNELLSMENSIDKKVKSNLDKIQKEYYLREQIKVIEEELGYENEDSIEGYKQKIEKKLLPDEIKEKALKEVSKLEKVNPMSVEYSVIVNYLDWILDLPWLESSSDDIDLKYARNILNKEHYGLKEVKERILEFIAVRKLTKTSKGSIICLVGPPGVGKTSIATSISHALKKNFVRMSLGGVTDEAEIRGHRRTYVGAFPGRVITSIKKAKENNPVFLFDEIDKLGPNYKGDPASGLLEVLDPEQNKTFTDHYLELPFDLSNVFFIATANNIQTIPLPLLDRMEIIPISGYTPEEKFNIAKKYLVSKQIKQNGLSKSNFKMSDGAIKDIINYYTREAGVRSLEKKIAKCCRKAAIEIVSNDKKLISTTSKNIEKYLGAKKFLFDTIEKTNQIGAVNGLAWTEVGGETLSIETTIMPGTGKLTLTGQLGDVMKESALAAISYIASNSKYYGVNPEFRMKEDIHIHVPEGAVPKDGPSAGITITTSVLSALKNQPVNRELAMTGEITLRGKVLPIGGLKEKLLAAERMGIKKVIIPYENKRDLEDMEKELLKKLEIIPVKEMKEVAKIAFEVK